MFGFPLARQRNYCARRRNGSRRRSPGRAERCNTGMAQGSILLGELATIRCRQFESLVEEPPELEPVEIAEMVGVGLV